MKPVWDSETRAMLDRLGPEERAAAVAAVEDAARGWEGLSPGLPRVRRLPPREDSEAFALRAGATVLLVAPDGRGNLEVLDVVRSGHIDYLSSLARGR